MFQHDLLLNEARKFAEMLARLIGLKASGEIAEFNQQAENILQNEYDTSVELLINLPEDDFRVQLQKLNYSNEKLNALGQLLYVFAEPFNDDVETASLLKKVLIIFDVLEQQYHFQTFDNIARQHNIHEYFIKYARS
jgi:hypothetical protein